MKRCGDTFLFLQKLEIQIAMQARNVTSNAEVQGR